VTVRGLIAAALVVVAGAVMPGDAQAACGTEPQPCEADGGTYHAVLPEGEALGAVMFLHGWGSSGEGSLRMTGMVRSFTERGYVVIAPDGTPRRGRNGRTWSFHPDRPAARDVHAFLDDVRQDAARRFRFDPDRVLLSGFSIGGSMAAYVACQHPDAFAAYAPIGGNFWRPHPEACSGPVRMLHTHGWADGTVPLEGRLLRGTSVDDPAALVQGDVFVAMDLFRRANGCRDPDPDRVEIGDIYWRRAWEACAPGSALELALHAGGHSIPPGWSDMVILWFEAQLPPA
jgi:polyhydroxybutyrate depolymerase